MARESVKRGMFLGIFSDDSIMGPLKTSILILVPGLILLFCIVFGFIAEGSQQFSLLAQGFLKGHSYFNQSIGGLGEDPVFFNGHVYWDEGPLPALVLLPFVAVFEVFHKLFFQGYIKWVFVVGTIYLIYKLARKFNYTKRDSLIMMFAFTLASVYIGINSVSSSWIFAQVINTFLMFVVLYEYFNKRRIFVMGVFVGLIFLTRAPATPIVLLPLITFLTEKQILKNRIKKCLLLLLPLFIAGCLSLGYNYVRFNDVFQNGNKYQLLGKGGQIARSYGLITPYHIPSNLYTALLRGPDIILKDTSSWTLKPPLLKNNKLGMSIILTSPYLLFFLITPWRKYTKEIKLLLLTSLISALIVLSYFGNGAEQMGYRYSMDFMPALFVAFMLLYKKVNARITRGMKALISLSILFNTFMLISYLAS